MSQLPYAARVYLVVVIALGAGALGGAILMQPWHAPAGLLLLSLASVATSVVLVKLPTSGSSTTMSIAHGANFVALLLLGTPGGILVGAVGAFAQCAVSTSMRPHRVAFNVSAVALVMGASGLVLVTLQPATWAGALVGPAAQIAGAALTYFFVNSVAIATAVALTTRRRVRDVWRADFVESAPACFVGAGCADTFVAAWRSGSWGLVPIGFAAIYLTYRAYRGYAARIAAEQVQLRRANERLAGQAALYRDLWDNAPVGYLEVGPDGRMRKTNQTALMMQGCAEGDADSVHPWDVIVERDAARQSILDRLEGRGDDGAHEWTFRRRDATLIDVLVQDRATRDSSGAVTGLRLTLQDVTARNRTRAIERSMRDAEAASRAKSELLATLSHEIRTPMNGIIGMTDLALERPASQAQRECLTTVRGCAESLLALLNNMLDFSKAEAGKVSLEHAPVDLRGVVFDAVTAFAPVAHRKGVELIARIDPHVPPTVIADAVRLRQIIVNLVNNAVKFTSAGEVVVSLTRVGGSADRVDLELVVRDTGVGIARDKQALIFEPFAQADASTTRHFGGTGLGLAIVGHLVEVFGGRIRVESEAGCGAAFHVGLTFGVPPSERPCDDERPLDRWRVLVGVREPSLRAAIVETLVEAGATADEVAEAAALMRAVAPGHRAWSAVVVDETIALDAEIPVVAGLRAALPAEAGIIVLATSTSMVRAGEAAAVAGAALLVRPVRPAALIDAVRGGAAASCATLTPPEPTVTPRPATGKVALVVDDNAVNRHLASHVLASLGFEVQVADGGRVALECLAARRFDLVLIDVEMPDLSGPEVTALVRDKERAEGGHVPILCVTAHVLPRVVDRCLAAGMDGVVTKPVNRADLVAAVERLTAHPVVDTGRDDWDAFDPGLMAELREKFLEVLPSQMDHLADALDRADLGEVASIAHTLKGSAGLFSEPASDAAACLERHARRGNVERVPAAGRALEQALHEVVSRLGGDAAWAARSSSDDATGDEVLLAVGPAVTFPCEEGSP